MELVRRIGSHLEIAAPAIHLQLPLYLRFILGLLLGVMVIVLGAVALTRLVQPPPSPFAAYEDLIAGDTQDPAFWSNHETLSRAAFDLACTTSMIEKYCLYRPPSGPFEVIQFNDLNDEGDSGIYFAVRDHALTIGDLALLWGRPTITRHEDWLALHWPVQGMSTLVRSDNGRLHYLLPLPYLLLAGYSNWRAGQ